MKRMILSLRNIFQGKYDPVSYWNSRVNPNNTEGESPDRVTFDTGYIRHAIGKNEHVLELGPGIGRTFPAYSRGLHVSTLDISSKYQEQLSSVAESLGITLTQNRLEPNEKFPFDDLAFSVGVVSQVLLHIPPEAIRHTVSELVRVCNKVVVITAYTHGLPVHRRGGNHVFNHDYLRLSTELGCEMNNVVMNEGRICFTLSKIKTNL